MSEILENIYNFFSYIKNLITEIFTLLKKAIGLLGYIPQYVQAVVNVLPWWCWTLMAVLTAVCILYKILGREGNA